MKRSRLLLPIVLALTACAGPDDTAPPEIAPLDTATSGGETPARPRESPPPSATPRDIAFPDVTRATVARGLELNSAEWHQLPVVYVQLVIRSGPETDPANLPGLASFVADMLKEGTRRKSSAQVAEAFDFLGASVTSSVDADNLRIGLRVERAGFEEAMRLLAEIVTQPAFAQDELDKLKRRETDRLALSMENPSWLAERAFYGALYGSHPYSRVDTTPQAIARLTRRDLQRWHQTHVVPSNSFVTIVGALSAADAQRITGEAFASWRGRDVTAPQADAPPARSSREIIVVDRPGSVQSVIAIGNVAVPRSAPDFTELTVANQVLGGGAAARLFMDLRERRSLTYGAYSEVDDRVMPGPFSASASVRTEVTVQAVQAFFEHLDRIVAEPPTADEVTNAARFLSDSFPMRIETPGRVGAYIANQRIFGLPDDYWETYRSRIRSVTAEQAFEAARAHIAPDHALVVVVGEANAFAEALRAYGPVTIVESDAAGTVRTRLEATAAP